MQCFEEINAVLEKNTKRRLNGLQQSRFVTGLSAAPYGSFAKIEMKSIRRLGLFKKISLKMKKLKHLMIIIIFSRQHILQYAGIKNIVFIFLALFVFIFVTDMLLRWVSNGVEQVYEPLNKGGGCCDTSS